MDEMQKLAYESTLQRLRDSFPDNPAPYVSHVAKYLKCSMYALLDDRAFRRLTYGKTQKRITLENIAAWQCRLRS